MDYREKFELLVNEISKKHISTASLISLYIPYNKPIEEILSKLKTERLNHDSIQQLHRSTTIKALIITLEQHMTVPEQGLCVFAGIRSDTEQTGEIFVIKCPVKIETYRFHCDNKYYTAPLDKMVHILDIMREL